MWMMLTTPTMLSWLSFEHSQPTNDVVMTILRASSHAGKMRPRTDHESVTVFWCMRPNGHAVWAFFADFSVFKRIFSYFSGGWRPWSAGHWFSALRASRSFLKCGARWCGSGDRRPRSWRFRTSATALVFLLFFSFGKENQNFAS